MRPALRQRSGRIREPFTERQAFGPVLAARAAQAHWNAGTRHSRGRTDLWVPVVVAFCGGADETPLRPTTAHTRSETSLGASMCMLFDSGYHGLDATFSRLDSEKSELRPVPAPSASLHLPLRAGSRLLE